MDDNSILLTSKMLHNIRNQLNRILGYSEILQDIESLSEEQIKMAKSITTAALNIRSSLSATSKDTNNDEHIDLDNKEQTNQEIKILIVDDNEDNRTVLSLILKKHPLKVLVAQNALESIQIAKSKRPDLIFMDIHLPDISGKEASLLIKQELPETKIIALTGDITMIEEEMSNKGIFESCISKPFCKHEIKNVITTFTQKISDGFKTTEKLSNKYLKELILCAKAGRVSCLENLIEQCDDIHIKQFLKEKLSSFNFEEIILWAAKTDKDNKIA